MDSKAFKIPIEYIHKIDIDNSIKEDLEFNSKNYSLYHSGYSVNEAP